PLTPLLPSQCRSPPRPPHSLPTRRSSDLDLVRPTRNYQRHMSGLGYYFVVNDYVDLLVSGDWYAGRYMSLRTQTRYRWLDRFVTDRKSTRLNSSHEWISYAVFCLKKKKDN